MSASGLSPSLKIKPEWVPKAAISRRFTKKPPSSDIFIVDYAVACNARFKALIEEFELDIHLFVPIELLYLDGNVMEGEYFYFACQVDVDCVLTDNQDEWFKGYRNGRILSTLGSIQKLSPLEISLSKPQIEGRHLRTGGPLGWNTMFVSDAFAEALKKSHIRGVERWRQCNEVDRPWIAEEHMGPLLEAWIAYETSGRSITMRWS